MGMELVKTLGADIRAALMLLTRLPMGPWPIDPARGAQSAWAWPMAGAILGAGAMATGLGALSLGLPAGFAAALVVAVAVMGSGALHEDGLADSADGLWGGQDRDRRLAIMKDSRIGSYGVLALGLTLIAKISLIAPLLTQSPLGVIAAAILSRAMMAPVMAALRPARADGLAQSFGQMPPRIAGLGMVLALGLAMVMAGWVALTAALAALGATLAVAGLARAKIGGQTGDILGAVQIMAELAALAAFVALSP